MIFAKVNGGNEKILKKEPDEKYNLSSCIWDGRGGTNNVYEKH